MPLSPGRIKLRHRILPRTVIGISFTLLSFAVGVAFSGAAFYAYYDSRLAENEATVTRFVESFDRQFNDAAGALDELRVDAIDDIRAELSPLDTYVDDVTALTQLPSRLGPGVWAVETLDDDGRPVVGTAFAVTAHGDGTALVTSLSVVATATVQPGPGIELVKDGRRIPARLWTWDDERDLALLVVDEPMPTLELAEAGAQTEAVGRPVFALSGVGGRGATASPGVLLDHSGVGLQHTAPVGTLFAGGPLVDGQGRVVGVAAPAYRPFGIDPGAVPMAPDVVGLCRRLLSCGDRLVVGQAAVAAEPVDGTADPAAADPAD